MALQQQQKMLVSSSLFQYTTDDGYSRMFPLLSFLPGQAREIAGQRLSALDWQRRVRALMCRK